MNEFDRIATALERIANALDGGVAKMVEPPMPEKRRKVPLGGAQPRTVRRAEARRIMAGNPGITRIEVAHRMGISERALRYVLSPKRHTR